MRPKNLNLPEQRSNRRRNPSLKFGLAWAGMVLFCVHQNTLRATDALKFVPADVTGVLSFRNIEECNKKLVSFAQQIDRDIKGLDVNEFEMVLGFEPGNIDITKPIHVIIFRPEELGAFMTGDGIGATEQPFPMIAFTPSRTEEFMKKVREQENRAFLQQGPFGKYYLLMRDGVAFVANKRKPLRLVRRVEPVDSLATAFDEGLKSVYKRSDVVLHLPLARWRDKVNFYVMFLTNFMKLGITAQQTAEKLEQTQAVMDWFIGGIRDAINQMETATFALDFDGTTFRFDHYHTFAKDRWMSDYLRQVRRAEVDFCTSLPDQPFIVLGTFNWQCPPKASMTGRFTQYYFNTNFVRETMSSEKREKLSNCLMEYSGQVQGMEFMLTSPSDRPFPFQIIGSEIVRDAPLALEQFRYIMENSDETMTAFFAGGARFEDKLTDCRHDGVKYLEMSLDFEGMPEMQRKQMTIFHGAKARYQQAAVSKHHLVYTIAEPPQCVTDLMHVVKSGSNVGDNPLVQKICSRLSKDANVVFIADVGRVLDMVAKLVGMVVEPPEHKPNENASSRPMLGFSCRARDHAIHCRWAMDANDVLEVRRLAGAYFGGSMHHKKRK